MYDIIEKKRDGKELTAEEIKYVIDGYTDGSIPDYQLSAWLMAVYFRSMTNEESASLTHRMATSGTTVDLSAVNGIKVDKHSTGGVGDSTTLCLAPLVASVGVPVAKMSGRGLGHTGGTLDKLESIPGFNIELSDEEFIRLINENGLAVMGQTSNLAPADKKIYSLRDVTATVNSIPLIASSIMSKKIASGADAIVLDVKVGSGAFMTNLEEAKQLAKVMVSIGKQNGKKTVAIISNMDEPLGYALGNALELKEAIDTLKGVGPSDLTELCLTLGSHMVVLGGVANHIAEAREMLEQNIKNGKALAYLKRFIKAQGGDDTVVDHPDKLPKAAYTVDLLAPKSGVVQAIDANKIGVATMMLGAGRSTKDDTIDLSVGIVLHKKVGDQVDKNTPLLTIHANHKSIEKIKQLLLDHILIVDKKAEQKNLIFETIDE